MSDTERSVIPLFPVPVDAFDIVGLDEGSNEEFGCAEFNAILTELRRSPKPPARIRVLRVTTAASRHADRLKVIFKVVETSEAGITSIIGTVVHSLHPFVRLTLEDDKAVLTVIPS